MYKNEKYVICQALGLWVNHIKYGTCTPEYKAKMNDLSDDQIDFISRLNKLKNDISSGKKVIQEKKKASIVDSFKWDIPSGTIRKR